MENIFPFDEEEELTEEQKQLLLSGRAEIGDFEKEFYGLFRHRESIVGKVLEMELKDGEE